MLGSGSSGNCALLAAKNSTILIDAGFSCKRIREMLNSREMDLERINAIFVTHEHMDHIEGLRGLRKYENIQFFANRETAAAIEKKFDLRILWRTFETGDKLTFGDFEIVSFSVPHDAADPIGYVFSVNEMEGKIRSIAWMTDLGYIPLHIAKYVSDVDLLIIESNYDNDLLAADRKRPPYIKARIRGRYGHLPNEAAINFLKNNESNRWKKVIFAHVSADCNSESCIKNLLGSIENLQFEVEIATP
jgi:phosphoribosyl 1,2-cyclic phosphodiesterase